MQTLKIGDIVSWDVKKTGWRLLWAKIWRKSIIERRIFEIMASVTSVQSSNKSSDIPEREETGGK